MRHLLPDARLTASTMLTKGAVQRLARASLTGGGIANEATSHFHLAAWQASINTD